MSSGYKIEVFVLQRPLATGLVERAQLLEDGFELGRLVLAYFIAKMVHYLLGCCQVDFPGALGEELGDHETHYFGALNHTFCRLELVVRV